MKYTVTYINGGAVNCPFVFEEGFVNTEQFSEYVMSLVSLDFKPMAHSIVVNDTACISCATGKLNLSGNITFYKNKTDIFNTKSKTGKVTVSFSMQSTEKILPSIYVS